MLADYPEWQALLPSLPPLPTYGASEDDLKSFSAAFDEVAYPVMCGMRDRFYAGWQAARTIPGGEERYTPDTVRLRDWFWAAVGLSEARKNPPPPEPTPAPPKPSRKARVVASEEDPDVFEEAYDDEAAGEEMLASIERMASLSKSCDQIDKNF